MLRCGYVAVGVILAYSRYAAETAVRFRNIAHTLC